jgi:hypothetical protein
MVDWSYEGYWNTVLGANRSADDVVREFDLDPTDHRGVDEWLGHAEAEACREGGIVVCPPASWDGYHAKALDALCGA